MTSMEWAEANIGVIILGVVFLVLFIYRYFEKRKLKKKETEEAPNTDTYSPELLSMESDLFEDIQGSDTLSTFRKQKASIGRSLMQVKKDAKAVVREEQQLDRDYRLKKMQFGNEKKRLGMKYSGWMNQNQILDEMISNQLRMQEELNKARR